MLAAQHSRQHSKFSAGAVVLSFGLQSHHGFNNLMKWFNAKIRSEQMVDSTCHYDLSALSVKQLVELH